MTDFKWVSDRTRRRRMHRSVCAFFSSEVQENNDGCGICPSTSEASINLDEHTDCEHPCNGSTSMPQEIPCSDSEPCVDSGEGLTVESGIEMTPSTTCTSDEHDLNESHDAHSSALTLLGITDIYDMQDEISDPDDSASSGDESDENPDDLPSIGQQLAEWFFSFPCISLAALAALLTLLRSFNLNLPKDPRTLLKTPRKYNISHFGGGKYHHFGLANGIAWCINQVTPGCLIPPSLTLHVNVDGLPLFKSSGLQLWPILGKVKELSCGPFLIGTWAGPKKPQDVDEFLEDFINDVEIIQANGLVINGHNYQVIVDAFICDAPARQFLKKVKTHTGYNSCERCTVEGSSVNRCIVFDEIGTLRTDGTFSSRADPSHHQGVSPLLKIGVGCVSQFVIDYMHLVCLGVTRRMVYAWMHQYRRHYATRIPARVMQAISDRLTHLTSRGLIPREFARKPRSLLEYKRWKATEWRQFLLYTGPVVLLGLVSLPVYENFLRLSVIMTILLNPRLAQSHADFVEKLTKQFVRSFQEVYGVDMMVYNVHTFLHIAQDAKRYGHLDEVSAFPFESFLGQLKKKVKRPSDPLPQIIRRTYERQRLTRPKEQGASSHGVKKPYHGGPLPEGIHCLEHYGSYKAADYLVSSSQGNDCFAFDSQIIVVKNIVKYNREIHAVYQSFINRNSFFQKPLDSRALGIFVVSSLSPTYLMCRISDLSHKCILIPHPHDEGAYVCKPLVHCFI